MASDRTRELAKKLDDLRARFWPKVDKNGPIPENHPELGPCWLWLGSISDKGYGQIMLGRKHLPAHRASLLLHGREIPDGLMADHLCRNRSCVNPEHLEAVTNRENILRGIGLSAENARKTHCKRGHEFSGENLRHRVEGWRGCRQCTREVSKKAMRATYWKDVEATRARRRERDRLKRLAAQPTPEVKK